MQFMFAIPSEYLFISFPSCTVEIIYLPLPVDVPAINTEAVPGRLSHRLGHARYRAGHERLTCTTES